MLCSSAHRRRNINMPRPLSSIACTSESSRTTIRASVSEVTVSCNLSAAALSQFCLALDHSQFTNVLTRNVQHRLPRDAACTGSTIPVLCAR